VRSARGVCMAGDRAYGVSGALLCVVLVVCVGLLLCKRHRRQSGCPTGVHRLQARHVYV
jgi:hypothetical protein